MRAARLLALVRGGGREEDASTDDSHSTERSQQAKWWRRTKIDAVNLKEGLIAIAKTQSETSSLVCYLFQPARKRSSEGFMVKLLEDVEESPIT